MVNLNIAELESPIGIITVAVHDGRLCALSFGDYWRDQVRWLERRFGAIDFQRSTDPAGVVRALRAYFDGQLTAIDRIDVDTGGTSFQASVWHALRRVPAGRTTSYGELARAVGSPQAARAVGAANGQNPVSIVVPCHRAIGGNGQLVGYGGGLDRKRWLLQHEGVLSGEATDQKLPLAG
ncbi:MAG: methylated-DNA--[protein]-cysteine S-methyltransferase [Acidobacteria bacterium]|jgi:O-6-methylguanine DNA methyltransferase|nr:MAG: methylated-DNA--[protein]-cysteine S-methyltransferase [Acidobacteriota bacterium]